MVASKNNVGIKLESINHTIFLMIVIANFLDIITTWIGVSIIGLCEANPLFKPYVENGIYLPFIIYKLILLFIVGFAVYLDKGKQPILYSTIIGIILLAGFLVYLYVVSINILWIILYLT